MGKSERELPDRALDFAIGWLKKAERSLIQHSENLMGILLSSLPEKMFKNLCRMLPQPENPKPQALLNLA